MNKGFFSELEMEMSSPAVPKKKDVKRTCEDCGAYKNCSHPKLCAKGRGMKKMLLLTDSAGEKGEFFSIREAEVLEQHMGPLNSYRTMSVVNCHMSKTPSDTAIEACRERVRMEISKFKPHVILCLGNVAVKSILGRSKESKKHITPRSAGASTLDKCRGLAFADREFKSWICSAFSPSYVLSQKKWEYKNSTEATFRNDISFALSMLNKPIPKMEEEESRIEILDEKQALLWIKSMKKLPTAFDYETTGLRPYRKGHKLVAMSLSQDRNHAVAFMYTDNMWAPLIRYFFREPEIPKYASNMKFEDIWTRQSVGRRVMSWKLDTMLASHVLDNREGVTGLKFQTFMRYGIVDYGSEVSQFLGAVPEEQDKYGANAINLIDQCPQQKLLLYNGMDSMLEFRLAEDQMKELKSRKLESAYQLLHDGTLALADMEHEGIEIDTEYLAKKRREVRKDISILREKLDSSREIKKWKSIFQDKFNMDSAPQLSELLYNHLGVEVTQETAKGNASVSASALESIDLPFIKDLMRLRKLMKVENTFLNGIGREVVDGKIHPFFNLNRVVTYRSSSDSPNFQNLPVRDKEMAEIVRRSIRVSKGFRIGELDFKGIEVSIACCYHRDPTMIAYLKDKSKDLHRDMAMECYMVSKEDMTKEIRYCGKNKFVFPEFYGSWYEDCARNLWEAIDSMKLETSKGVPLKEHLENRGVEKFSDFENHIKAVEKKFWSKTFPVYDKWKKRWWDKYREEGRMKMFTGFECSGEIGRNDSVNYPVQGPAFHCLLKTCILLNEKVHEKGMQSRLIGQIHDSMIWKIKSGEEKRLYGIIRNTIAELPLEWKWITTPLDVEFDITPEGGSWFDKKEYKEKKEATNEQ